MSSPVRMWKTEQALSRLPAHTNGPKGRNLTCALLVSRSSAQQQLLGTLTFFNPASK
jgi:hypothetical protein